MRALHLAGVATVAVLGLAACGASTRVLLGSHREEPDSLRQLMRGGARLGCTVPQAYSRAAGLAIECKEGRVVLGKRTGDNRGAPGHPMQVTCTGALAARCEPFYEELWRAGAPACADDEVIPGCGALQCAPPDDAPDTCERMTEEN